MSTSFKPLETFDHVVVLMLENRSFDNLLGYLYEGRTVPEGKSFAGLQNKEHCNPIPKEVQKPGEPTSFCMKYAKNYHSPFPDPGEVYRHVNTQLFNDISLGNWCVDVTDMKPPYNIPSNKGFNPLKPGMDGFVKDYVNTLCALHKENEEKEADKKNKHLPPYNYATFEQIMESFPRNMVNVSCQLADNFSVFDHWFCSVPSQTWCNRAFWHAGTSGGRVSNGPKGWWEPSKNKTLFNQLEEKGIDWGIYTDNLVSLTGIIHFRALLDYHFTRFHSYKKFKKDLRKKCLPTYSFIEPRFFTPHNDQHPSTYNSRFYGPSATGAVLLGEHLIYDVYESLRKSAYKDNTLFIITHDEHGGTYDHIPPGAAVHPENGEPGEDGFTFDRLGVRVPMIMISSHIDSGTIINEQFDHTSFLYTLHKKWGLTNLTNRDKAENNQSFESVFSPTKRDWPKLIPPRPLPKGWNKIDFSDSPINDLQESMLHASHEFVARKKGKEPKEMPLLETQKDAMKFLRKKKKKVPGARYRKLTLKT